LQPHQVISEKYELLRLMSSGGMGSVWVANHRALGNHVAIKLLHERTTCDEPRERLILEARLAARMEHGNIVRVLDLGFTEWNAPYVVMELLDGRDLRSELHEAGRLTPVRAVQLLLPVLEGLAYAHDRHIVHRDLKPETIFLDYTQGGDYVIPKIVDFGIAGCLTDSAPTRITSSGGVFGTVNYLSTEQALGQDDVDHRADIWSVCAILYECITGEAPFGDRAPAQALEAIIQEDIPPPSTLGIDDEGLAPILMQGLCRDRRHRWPDARSLGQALGRWLLARGVSDDASAQSVRARWFGNLPDGESNPSIRLVPALVTPQCPPSARRAKEATTLVAKLGTRTKAKWIALAVATLVLVSGAALAHSPDEMPKLRRAGMILPVRPATTQIAEVARPRVVAQPPARATATVDRRVPATATVAVKPGSYDPVLGF
jgi:serine/threonine protein kinase